MKKLILLLTVCYSFTLHAQSNYQKGMQKAFSLWSQDKTNEASQLFERIAKAEKDNWLPYYYVAFIEITGSFGLKDENTLDAKLKKAKTFIDEAASISPNNPEIIIARALLNTGYIAFDGQKYGMTLSGENAQLYNKALAIAPNNPRVILSKAEWDMGAARFFGKSTKPYCNQIKKAIEIGKKKKVEKEFYPKFQVKRAEKVLAQCEG